MKSSQVLCLLSLLLLAACGGGGASHQRQQTQLLPVRLSALFTSFEDVRHQLPCQIRLETAETGFSANIPLWRLGDQRPVSAFRYDVLEGRFVSIPRDLSTFVHQVEDWDGENQIVTLSGNGNRWRVNTYDDASEDPNFRFFTRVGGREVPWRHELTHFRDGLSGGLNHNVDWRAERKSQSAGQVNEFHNRSSIGTREVVLHTTVGQIPAVLVEVVRNPVGRPPSNQDVWVIGAEGVLLKWSISLSSHQNGRLRINESLCRT
jgi:hypothetical protein